MSPQMTVHFSSALNLSYFSSSPKPCFQPQLNRLYPLYMTYNNNTVMITIYKKIIIAELYHMLDHVKWA